MRLRGGWGEFQLLVRFGSVRDWVGRYMCDCGGIAGGGMYYLGTED